MPLLQGGVTDGRFFSQLGIQTYGFMPMRLPADFPVLKVVHAADERIPAAALEFGTEAVDASPAAVLMADKDYSATPLGKKLGAKPGVGVLVFLTTSRA